MNKKERVEETKRMLGFTYMNRDNYLKWLDTPYRVYEELQYLTIRVAEKNDDLTQAVLEMKLDDVRKLKEEMK